MMTSPAEGQAEKVYRHALPVRLGHWINVICVVILIRRGLQIFNAHPALYWGDRSDRDRPLLSIRAVKTDEGIKGVGGRPAPSVKSACQPGLTRSEYTVSQRMVEGRPVPREVVDP